MQHFILNLSDGDREQAAARLRARIWTLRRDERHGAALAPGDLVLIHVGQPRCAFVGRAELASAFQAPGSVALADVEEWALAVPLDAVVRRIDPTASNPYVQANAAGFPSGVVAITAGEYAAVLALSRAQGAITPSENRRAPSA
jgi:hypothetical protein